MITDIWMLIEDDGSSEGELVLKTFVNADLAKFWMDMANRRYPDKNLFLSTRAIELSTPSEGDIETLWS